MEWFSPRLHLIDCFWLFRADVVVGVSATKASATRHGKKRNVEFDVERGGRDKHSAGVTVMGYMVEILE